MPDDKNIIDNIEIIKTQTLNWCRRRGIPNDDIEDYQAQSMLLLCQASRSNKYPQKAKFKTWAWFVVWCGLEDYRRIERGHQDMINEIKEKMS